MSEEYIIKWVGGENGRSGKGTKRFSLEEARNLCAELNHEYPKIRHTPERVGGEPEPAAPAPATPDEAPANRAFGYMDDDSPMPFGEHKGKPMREVPSHYLDYLRGMAWLPTSWPSLHGYIERNRKSINQDLERKERSK